MTIQARDAFKGVNWSVVIPWAVSAFAVIVIGYSRSDFALGNHTERIARLETNDRTIEEIIRDTANQRYQQIADLRERMAHLESITATIKEQSDETRRAREQETIALSERLARVEALLLRKP